ncbi:MAG TPA: RNA 2',3'-cyclic phosphodiesterase [Burkholderiaceae bacterium]
MQTATPQPAMARLFLALWPDAAAHAQLLHWQRSWYWPQGAKLTAPEKLHVTLHFIGNVPLHRIEEVKEGLAAPCPAIALDFGHPAVWNQGLAVLEPVRQADTSALQGLHDVLATGLAQLGLATERRTYRPHITLARRAGGARPAEATPDPVLLQADRYVLVRSDTATGRYEILRTY